MVWKPSTFAYSSANFFITCKARTIEWRGHGLKIHIPDNSLAPSVHSFVRTQLEVHMHTFDMDAFENPHYSLPTRYPGYSYVPVSLLYSIRMGMGKLCKPVTIEFQHCLDLSKSDNLRISDLESSIIIGTKSKFDLVILRSADVTNYFEPVDDAVFDRRTRYGKVTVPKLDGNQEYDDFSWFIIALRRIFLPTTIRYKAHVYTSKSAMKMYFIVTMALEPCTTVGYYNT